MSCNRLKIQENVGFVSGSQLNGILTARQLPEEVSVLVISISEEMAKLLDVKETEEILSELPVITIGVLTGTVGKNALLLASAMHLRIALADANYMAEQKNCLNDMRILSLLGSSAKEMVLEGCVQKIDIEALLKLGYVSEIYEGMECEEFEKWLKTLFYKKDKTQLMAIKRCYDKYRYVLPKTTNRGTVSMEESRQFCLLADYAAKKSRVEA